jgi:hypothetical protein
MVPLWIERDKQETCPIHGRPDAFIEAKKIGEKRQAAGPAYFD